MSEELEQVIIMGKVVDPVERKGGMRLNNEMRETIIKKAISHAYDKREAALKKEATALNKEFYTKTFGAAKIKHALAAGSPFVTVGEDAYGYDCKDPQQQWNVGGQWVQLPALGLPLCPHTSHHRKNEFVISDEALVEKCRDWQGRKEALRNEIAKTTATLGSMLSKINTYPSLEKNWPQGKKFYKHLPVDYPFRHQVPAVQIDELNKALGL